jgi:hypothetical protein
MKEEKGKKLSDNGERIKSMINLISKNLFPGT